jgi:DNA-directed RNA polymerase subunit RPC12/RpoP
MDDSNSVMLRCDNCGHTWKPRSTEGKARQCSKCRSRRISVIEQEDSHSISPLAQSSKSKRISASTIPSPSNIHPSIKEDPDIIAKMKELELVRIERQIVEEQKAIVKARAIDSLAKAYYCLLDAAWLGIKLDDDTYEELVSVCLYCGSTGDAGLEYIEERVNGGNSVQYYQCRSCGRRIEI